MTEEEIRARLGLMPADEFRKMQIQENEKLIWERVKGHSDHVAATIHIQMKYRRTGRTTNMLIKAVEALSKGESVLVLGHTLWYSRQLYSDLREMCLRCGVDDSKVKFPTSQSENQVRGTNALVFHDHYWN